MARPREFDEEVVLENAVACFWEKGFDAASIADLETATGISRISLYNAFGDKLGLFLAVQKRYRAMAEELVTQGLGEPDFDRLLGFFANVSMDRPDGAPQHHGCLMVNTVLDARNVDGQVLGQIREFREMFTASFREYLGALQDQGVIRKELDVAGAAEFLLASIWGAATIIRLEGHCTAARPHIDMVLATIRGWRV